MKRQFTSRMLTAFCLLLSCSLFAQCDNVTDPGSIAADQTVCAENPDPAPLTSTELPTGGSGDLEYIWIFTTQEPTNPFVTWQPIPDSNSPEIDPAPIEQTTYYRRCARRAGCTDFAFGESNIVTVIYQEDCDTDDCEFFKLNLDNIVAADCGLANGSVTVSVVAGTEPFMYVLNGESSDTLPTVFAAGNYVLQVTDAAGCTDTETFTIEGGENDLTVTAETENPLCNAPNGSIDLTVTGGNQPFTYLWSDGNTDPDRENLLAGTYTITVTDANGCSRTESFVLIQVDTELEVNITVMNEGCAGSADGGATIEILNGTPPFIVKLDNVPVTEISNLPPGEYTVSISDLNGCAYFETITILPGVDNIAFNASIVQPSCASPGSITLAPSGGTPPYTVSYPDGSTELVRDSLPAGVYAATITDASGCTGFGILVLFEPENTLTAEVNVTAADCGANNGGAEILISGGTAPFTLSIDGMPGAEVNILPPGMYDFTVEDAEGCTFSDSFTIAENDSDIMINATTTDPTCTAANGSILLTLTGGAGNISVLWNDGSTDSDRLNLAAGTYSVTTTDANGCTAEENFTLTATDGELDFSITINDVNCNGGTDASFALDITDGTEPYTVFIDGTEVDDFTNLAAGEYLISVNDAAGCTVEMPITIAQPPLLLVDAEIINPGCAGNDGSIQLLLSGGTGTYTVVWTDDADAGLLRENLTAGSYTVNVKDENNCVTTVTFTLTDTEGMLNLDLEIFDVACFGENTGEVLPAVTGAEMPVVFMLNGTENAPLNALAAGDYELTATDANGCSAVVNFTVSQPATLLITETVNNANCGQNNGSIDLEIVGGTPFPDDGYNIEWNAGNGENLAAGSYSVTVTDAENCTLTETYTVTGGEEFSVMIATETADCNGGEGSVMMSFQGGTPPFAYNLNGEIMTDLPLTLSAGFYQLLVTDAAGCSDAVEFLIGQPTAINYFAEILDAECGEDTAAVNFFSLSGGTGEYTFLWSDGATDFDRTFTENGDYRLTITDSNGCTAVSQIFEIFIPEPIVIDADENPGDFQGITCAGADDATVTVTVAGGVEPYTYQWSNGATTPTIDSLPPGEYLLNVTDSLGCSEIFVATFPEPTEFFFESLTVTDADCNLENGSLTVTPAGGSAPYVFFLDGTQTENEVTDLSPGNYEITARDANGCEIAATFTVAEIGCLTGSGFVFLITENTVDLAAQSVELHWMTEGETNNGFFIVEHSLDGENYTDASGLLPGNGTEATHEYFNLCENMALGTHFFRIRYIDAAGNMLRSEVTEAKLLPQNSTAFSVYPNPFTSEFSVNLLRVGTQNQTMVLTNILGHEIMREVLPAGDLVRRFDLSDKKAGIYFVTIVCAGKRNRTLRLVKS